MDFWKIPHIVRISYEILYEVKFVGEVKVAHFEESMQPDMPSSGFGSFWQITLFGIFEKWNHPQIKGCFSLLLTLRGKIIPVHEPLVYREHDNPKIG